MKKITLGIISQVWIALFGASAMWFIGRPEPWSAYGFLLGLIAQPAWFYTTIKHKQWGITVLSIFYTYSWVQGAYYKLLPNMQHHGWLF